MGLKYHNFFENSKYDHPNSEIIICKNCSFHICLTSLILSISSNSSNDSNFLVKKLINYEIEKNSQKSQMKTGLFDINNIICCQCKSKLGWYYKKAYSYLEIYKEGKFAVENKYVLFIPCQSSKK